MWIKKKDGGGGKSFDVIFSFTVVFVTFKWKFIKKLWQFFFFFHFILKIYKYYFQTYKTALLFKKYRPEQIWQKMG